MSSRRYHIAVDLITGFRLQRRGRDVVDARQRRGGGAPASNRVTGRRGPRHAVSSINPRRIVHFRFRRESTLTQKIRLDRAQRDHPVGGRTVDCSSTIMERNGTLG